jgi:SAM-dependent methyltransferase
MNINEDQTRQVAQPWKVNQYYERAEREDWMRVFWNSTGRFRPLFDTLDTRILVELACGRGRHTAHILNTPELRRNIQQMYIMDVNEENVNPCRERFADIPCVHASVNSGYDFQPLNEQSVTAIFCYDAMVHFEYDAVISYLQDAYRILVPGGRALFHHSNYDRSPGTAGTANPSWRNFMSKDLFAHVAIRSGFRIVRQCVLDWDDSRKIDCLSLIEKREGPKKITWVDPPRPGIPTRVLRKMKRILRG